MRSVLEKINTKISTKNAGQNDRNKVTALASDKTKLAVKSPVVSRQKLAGKSRQIWREYDVTSSIRHRFVIKANYPEVTG